MCYTAMVSTTSDRDLREFNTASVHFAPELPAIPEASLLRYENKWHLGSRHGSSCGFRHLDQGNADLGFAPSVDWWPEEKEDIEATLQAVSAFKAILGEGSKLDCIDAWEQDPGSAPRLCGELVVDLATLPDVNFRFLEGYRLEFTSET